MWKNYEVELKFHTPFASSTPKNPLEIKDMLEARMPAKPPEDATPIEELAGQVAEEVGSPDAEVEKGHATFKKDDQGLYYEARCIRAHIKDCAAQVQKILEIRGLKPKVANRVYVEPSKIYLGKSEPDGYEVRPVHAMLPRGPISSLKAIDYLNDVTLEFRLKVLDDGIITEDILKTIFEYGGIHGMGQERSQDWGKYVVVKLIAK